ncbi:SlyX family protein [Succinimonas sp.]|jgi:SlyX protein|uniref:SlyX family protein n=1 Tax=Succinimonas sp. TaxID=1936151 RepID=UPI003866F91F
MKENSPETNEDLETRLAYLEYNQERLSQELYEQGLIIKKQEIQLKYLANKLKAYESSNIAPRSEETPPPHY